MGIQLTPEEKFEIFGENYSEDYETEAEQRWGNTEAWKQSQQRTAKLTKQEWVELKEAGDDLNRRMAAAMRAGTATDSTTAMDLAEEHRAGIERFYECSYEMHRGLADMYLADERFTRTYEDVAPGLAQNLFLGANVGASRDATRHQWSAMPDGQKFLVRLANNSGTSSVTRGSGPAAPPTYNAASASGAPAASLGALTGALTVVVGWPAAFATGGK